MRALDKTRPAAGILADRRLQGTVTRAQGSHVQFRTLSPQSCGNFYESIKRLICVCELPGVVA